MGNCVSCTEPGEPDRPNLTVTSNLTGTETTAFNGSSRTPTSSAYITNSSNNTVLLESSGANNINMSHRSEKRSLYSRIPPSLGLGRSSSDKRRSSASNNSIKDNNNAYSESKISTLFDYYKSKDPSEDWIGAEGIEKLCKDLDFIPEDYKVLVLAWVFKAEQMCIFTREEFYRGMRELKTDSIKGIQARLYDVADETLSNSQKFKELYQFAFKFGLDTEIGQKVLPTDMAISLWKVVFSNPQKSPPILKDWIFFLENHTQIRGIPRDTWVMFLHFVETVGSDLSAYDEDDAYPSLFDDFVEFYKSDQLNQAVSPSPVHLINNSNERSEISQNQNDTSSYDQSSTLRNFANQSSD